ncbi:hypothetical protein [Arsukibacterium sp.]|uniref:hypothetical protein n=1 Tax=Arsukibacterium sp. TaxID=1977258 RepID=UPI003566701D
MPVPSYLYQPPVPIPAGTAAATSDPIKDAVTEVRTATVSSEQAITNKPAQGVAAPKNNAEAGLTLAQDPTKIQTHAGQASEDTLSATPARGGSLVQRALNRAASVDPAIVEQDAAASYQQFLQRQQPRLTVEKQHWPVSENPAQQVLAQLDDGRQIVRIRKGVCVVGDPMLDGFEALMAAKRVPCGDEIKTSELLKQALDKHIKKL